MKKPPDVIYIDTESTYQKKIDLINLMRYAAKIYDLYLFDRAYDRFRELV